MLAGARLDQSSAPFTGTFREAVQAMGEGDWGSSWPGMDATRPPPWAGELDAETRVSLVGRFYH